MSVLVSIIMPAYNSAAFIAEAINSVLGQTYSSWELIIVNDGSIDKTEEIVQSYQDARIKYFSQNNQGVSAARNLGLEHMKGDYFCFLDADDALPQNSLISRLEKFKQDNHVEYVDGMVEIFNNDFSKHIKNWTPKYFGNPLNDLLSLSGFSFFGPTWMIKRKPGVTYHFKEGLTHGEDLLFYINLARNGGIYAYTKETVLHYRMGHQSAMKNLYGLEKGYREIYHEILKMNDISYNLKSSYIKKARSIVFKSYLGHAQLIKAFQSLISRW